MFRNWPHTSSSTLVLLSASPALSCRPWCCPVEPRQSQRTLTSDEVTLTAMKSDQTNKQYCFLVLSKHGHKHGHCANHNTKCLSLLTHMSDCGVFIAFISPGFSFLLHKINQDHRINMLPHSHQFRGNLNFLDCSPKSLCPNPAYNKPFLTPFYWDTIWFSMECVFPCYNEL